MKKHISIILLFFLPFLLFSQQIRELSQAELDQVARLTEMANLYLNDGDSENAGLTFNRVAFIFWRAGRPREAADYFISAADLYLKKDKLTEAKNIYSNIGVLYTDLEELEFAGVYFEKSLNLRRKIGNKTDISAGLVDVAYIYQLLGNNDDAIDYLNEALNLATTVKNSRLILDCYQLLSLNYEQAGNIRKSKEFAGKAESYQTFLTEESRTEEFEGEKLQIEQKVAQTEEEKRNAQLQFELDQLKFKAAEDSLNITLKLKQDSLFQAERMARASQLEIENLNIEKENQRLAIEQQKIKARNQQLVILMVAIGLILMVLIAIIMLRANQARKKANQKLEKQNKEIAEKSEQLGSALKKIAHQNQNITQSINYAKGIQTALLPKTEQLTDLIQDSFILFQPRDIVSGDFYWFREIDSKSDIFKIFGMHRKENQSDSQKNSPKKIVVSAVDCTGHGVPGAFMSMIGYNLLDEITNKGITRPDLILEELHRGVRTALKQKETNNQDGMDMAICVIDPEKKILEFSGAKNPMIYVQNGEVQQIKGDKYGIGGKSDDHKFTTHTLDVNQPTWVYLFSDGYIDQFGGEQGRKFMIKNFREMLYRIHDLPMIEQRKFLESELKSWIGTKYSQIDDVLVIGFKVDFSAN